MRVWGAAFRIYPYGPGICIIWCLSNFKHDTSRILTGVIPKIKETAGGEFRVYIRLLEGFLVKRNMPSSRAGKPQPSLG